MMYPTNGVFAHTQPTISHNWQVALSAGVLHHRHRLDRFSMFKLPKNTVRRDPRTGQVVKRGTKVGEFTVMGTAVDGTIIVAPKQKPKSFTVREIQDVVRTVKDERRKGMLDTVS